MKTLQDQHAELEINHASKIEAHYVQSLDQEKMHSFEMRKMAGQNKELVAKIES
jgi:hypothetical protein